MFPQQRFPFYFLETRNVAQQMWRVRANGETFRELAMFPQHLRRLRGDHNEGAIDTQERSALVSHACHSLFARLTLNSLARLNNACFDWLIHE